MNDLRGFIGDASLAEKDLSERVGRFSRLSYPRDQAVTLACALLLDERLAMLSTLVSQLTLAVVDVAGRIDSSVPPLANAGPVDAKPRRR